MLQYFIFISALFCAGCVKHVDEGGVVGVYYQETASARNAGIKVVLDYDCRSACLIRLSSGPGLCVSKDAIFGVHEPHFAPGNLDYSQGVRVEKLVNAFKQLLPSCAVKLFDRKHAFDRPKLTYFSGEEVLKNCPEIKECPDDA
jgi:hypothetical protein